MDSKEERLDKVNLLEYIESNTPSDKVLYSRVIQDAASNYLYAFTAKNGIGIEEFFSAWQYLFQITSTNKMNWNRSRTLRLSYISKGNRVVENRYLLDNELSLMCFDKHYDFSGLSKYMHIDKFRLGLKSKRTEILEQNWEYVQSHVTNLYKKELNQIADNRQLPLQVWDNNLLLTLVDPPSPLHLASIFYVPKKLKKEVKMKASKQLTSGKYAKLIEKIENNSLQSLGSDWGPLSSLGV